MNKTFLLTACAAHTEGAMLITIGSLAEFIQLFKEYHHKKMEFMLGKLPRFYDLETRKNTHGKAWVDLVNSYREAELEFAKQSLGKPFNFELSIGCHYIESGKGKDIFYDNLRISASDLPSNETYWRVVNEFNSDLPRGTHYCGDCDA